MAGSKSNYLSANMIQHYLGGVAAASPANVYVALCTAAVSDTSTGATITETNYTSYARTQVGSANDQTTAWNTATGTTTSTVTNKNAITFPTATGASGSPIISIAVLDSATAGAGNILYWCDVTSTAIASGDTPKINASGLSVTED